MKLQEYPPKKSDNYQQLLMNYIRKCKTHIQRM